MCVLDKLTAFSRSLHDDLFFQGFSQFRIDDTPEAVGWQESHHSNKECISKDGLDVFVPLSQLMSRSVVDIECCEVEGCGYNLNQQWDCQLSDSLAIYLRNVEAFCDFFADDGRKGER